MATTRTASPAKKSGTKQTAKKSEGPTDGLTRCGWAIASGEALYVAYHDKEWGVPVHDDHRHFAFLILEGAQAGLSWLTVLRKREAYYRAFSNFDPRKVARYNPAKIERLLADPGIIRNRLKVESAVTNARAFLSVQEEFGSFDAYLWNFVDGRPVKNHWRRLSQIPPRSALSDRLSADLKKRGFRFVGTTIMYSHLQACGLINDHLVRCFRYDQVS